MYNCLIDVQMVTTSMIIVMLAALYTLYSLHEVMGDMKKMIMSAKVGLAGGIMTGLLAFFTMLVMEITIGGFDITLNDSMLEIVLCLAIVLGFVLFFIGAWINDSIKSVMTCRSEFQEKVDNTSMIRDEYEGL